MPIGFLERTYASKPLPGALLAPGNYLDQLTGCYFLNDDGGPITRNLAHRAAVQDAAFTSTGVSWTKGSNFPGPVVTFNGTNSTWINCGANGWRTTNTPLSVSAWFRLGSGVTGNRAIAGHWGTQEDWVLYLSGGQLFYGGRVAGVFRFTNTTPTYNDGLWHHVLGVAIGAFITIYVDGVQVVQKTDSTGNFQHSAGSTLDTIGNRATGDYSFNGDIGCVFIWNRALLAHDASVLYSNKFIMGHADRLWFSISDVAPTIMSRRESPSARVGSRM